MKYVVLLSVEGMEQLAKGGEPFNWQLGVIKADELKAHLDCYPDKQKVASFTAHFPTAEACIAPVLAKLKQREQEIQAEAYEEMKKIKQRRDDLLALTLSPTSGDVV